MLTASKMSITKMLKYLILKMIHLYLSTELFLNQMKLILMYKKHLKAY